MNRFIWALRHEIALHIRNLVVISLAVAGAMMLFRMLPWVHRVQVINVWNTFSVVTMVTGLIITAGSFQELQSPGHRIELLLRPATVVEKVGAKLLVTTVLFWLLMTAAHVAVSLLGAALYRLAGGVEPLTGFFHEGMWLAGAVETLPNYLPLHAVFFFGAVYFRRHPAGRTTLAAVGWVSSYVIAAVVAVRFIFAPYMGASRRFGRRSAMGVELGGEFGLQFNEQIWQEIAPLYLQNPELLATVLRILMVAAFWGLAFLRFRETEG